MNRHIYFLILIHIALATQCPHVDISETSFDSPITQVHWLSKSDDRNILVKTKSDEIWRSANGGDTWSNQLVHMAESGAGVYKMISSPSDSCVVFFIGHATTQWNTRDGGQTYSTLKSGLDLYLIQFHPTKPTWLLGLSKSQNQYDLHISQDTGQTWNLILRGVHGNSFDWINNNGVLAIRRSDLSVVSLSITGDVRIAVDGPVGGLMVDKHIFVTTQGNKLLVSNDNAMTFSSTIYPSSFHRLPSHFTWLSDRFGSVVMQMALSSNQSMGDVLISDSSGSRFAVSLEDVWMTGGYGHFVPMNSLPGTYVANIIKGGAIETRMSYDHGASWEGLRCNGQPLHLHTTPRTLYSTSNAIGMMIGLGNTGDSLSTTSHTLYLTRDGGHEWISMYNGNGVYRFGDRGGIVVLVAGDDLHYSVDEGMSWQTCHLSNMNVKDIYVEPMAEGRTFIIIGTSNIIRVNLTSVHQRVCGDDDYEAWYPQGSLVDRYCMLGHHNTYLRRMRQAECLVEMDTSRVVSTTKCSCSNGDYECDVCYTRDRVTSPCIWDTRLCHPRNDKLCNETMGYRKIPGDVCSGSVDIVQCVGTAWLWLLLVPVIIVSVVGATKIGMFDACRYRRRRAGKRGGVGRRRTEWSDEWWSRVFTMFDRPYRFTRLERHESDDDVDMDNV